ncbi:MAG: preprotein translocase subunit YajC [Thermonema sp.]|uniref:preprotein translocase subunit YajC n=1 Tax=Thermonema TaxID=28194 RepID=UPI0005717679|nr:MULTISPECIES: preprotein translocase subunit YajC [Thermonema]GIV39011.1 MAG: preprotein translocase subunit YajC [Thermonema sp.]
MLQTILFVFLQQKAAQPQGGGMMFNLIFFGTIILIFYFFMIRPQQKRAKEQKNFLASLQKGMQVVTIGGIHGKIVEVGDNTVTIDIDGKGTKVVFEKNAIAVESTKALQKA